MIFLTDKPQCKYGFIIIVPLTYGIWIYIYICTHTLIQVLAVVPINHHNRFLTKEEK